MKALFIDTPHRSVYQCEYDGDWKSIAPTLHATCFTVVGLSNGDSLFVDDEGLINGNPHGWFLIRNYGNPLRGYGLVLGCDEEGNSVEPRTTLDILQTMVSFPEEEDLNPPESYAKVEIYTGDEALRRMGLK